MLESTRAKEEAVKRETIEQLTLFRRQQEEADKALLQADRSKDEDQGGKAGDPTAGESQWAINNRKRKRAKEKEVLKGVKVRRSSTTGGLERRGSVSQELEKVKAALPSTATEEGRAVRPGPSFEDKATATTPGSPSAKPERTLTATPPKPADLGLAGYSSEEEE